MYEPLLLPGFVVGFLNACLDKFSLFLFGLQMANWGTCMTTLRDMQIRKHLLFLRDKNTRRLVTDTRIYSFLNLDMFRSLQLGLGSPQIDGELPRRKNSILNIVAALIVKVPL